MKYVVLAVTDHSGIGEMTRHVPIIFPDMLTHSEVAKAITRTLRAEVPDGRMRDIQPVSAGFLSSLVISDGKKPICHGFSESMNLASRPVEDSALIATYDYLHGIQP